MNNLITDYFVCESQIVDRIKAQIPELKSVSTPFNLEDALESSQNSPAVYVIYAGDVVNGNSVGNGESRTISQRWLIVLAVRKANSQLQQTSSIRGDAGVIIPKLLNALQGWKPNAACRNIARVPGAPPPAASSSFAYFPYLFETVIIT